MGGLIETLTRHRIAANGLMLLVLIVGAWSLSHVNRQYFPDFDIDRINVNATWDGASAEDVQEALGVPLENAIIGLTGVDRVSTTSRESSVNLSIRMLEGADLKQGVEDIEDAIAVVNLPEGVDDPSVNPVIRYEPLVNLLIHGDVGIAELIPLARKLRLELLNEGIAQVRVRGMPSEQVSIQVPVENLLDNGLTLNGLAGAINTESNNLPAGVAGDRDIATQLRAQGQARTVNEYSDLIIGTDLETGAQLRLGDLAHIERKLEDDYHAIFYQGNPAIEFDLRRAVGQDSLDMAQIYIDWLEEVRPTLPEGIEIYAFDEQWAFLESRMSLVGWNAFFGMVLVLVVLFVFLNHRLAIWVVAGIPISFFVTFIFMDVNDLTINVISLFGFMIALGIVVDDAIVVGEDCMVLREQGYSATDAAVMAAKRMWPPVLASSLTTVAAFLPLLLIDGIRGAIMRDIPEIVVCAIIASLIECFFILPGHLAHSMKKKKSQPSKFRETVDGYVYAFRDQVFRPALTWALNYRLGLFTVFICVFILAKGLLDEGHINLRLWPSIERPSMTVDVEFAVGTTEERVAEFLAEMEQKLREVERETGYGFINTVTLEQRERGPGTGSVKVELEASTDRPLTNQQLVSLWRAKVDIPPGVEKITFGRARWGSPYSDLTVRLEGEDTDQLKFASLSVQDAMRNFQGVSDLKDDLPYGSEQWRFSLTPEARTMGVNMAGLASDLQAMLDGRKVQFIQDGGDEVDILIELPEEQRDRLSSLNSLPVTLSNGDWLPLASLLQVDVGRGLDSLRRQDGELSVVVTADVDDNQASTTLIQEQLMQEVLPSIESEFGVISNVEGDRREERQVYNDMLFGAIISFLIVFGILAWVFESWTWPLAVLVSVPFGFTGALIGLWVMDLDMTLLSMFGLFGLAGIVINDSIVLISFYRRLKAEGMEITEAVIEAACQRLRPVLLTSITTIAGLTPLLFEDSFDAQFLIPMAAVIVFGLAFGTLLILFLVPGVLLTIEEISHRLKGITKIQRMQKQT